MHHDASYRPLAFVNSFEIMLPQVLIIMWLSDRVKLPIVGEVFEVPKVESEKITDELVQQVHSDFCVRLKKLFDDYKKVYVDEMGADPE